jgi:4-amino-4-deoxy-L-arabinose transferase-like glycosyltransferase
LTAALLFVGLAALFALTRSHWLDDWDSINFALALDDFDVTRHRPHPPGYPLYVAAGKLVHLVIADHAAALTLVSSLAGAAVASMFYFLDRRQNSWPVAICATLIMALSPLFWLQSGLALTDMFGMVFVLAFLLVEGTSPPTPRGDLVRRITCGVIAGLALGARPHIAFLIVVYWCIRAVSSRSVGATHVLTAAVAFLAGVVAWLIPASMATGGIETYLHATVGQFEWRFGRPGVSVLGTSISGSYLLSRAAALIGSLGQAFAPMHLTASNAARRVGIGLVVIALYAFFAWRSPSKNVARPYMLACAVYLLMLLILLPVRHAVLLAARAHRRLVGLWLPGAVPEAAGTRRGPRGPHCGHCAALVLSGRRSHQSSAAGRGTRLGKGEPPSGDPLFGPASPARGLLLARRRLQSGAEG